QWNRAAAGRHCRGIELRNAVNESLGRFAEWKNLLFRTAAAGDSQARQQEGGGHDLDEMPAADWIGKFACASRKLALDPLLKVRRIGQLIKTAPITLPRERLWTRRRNRFHRWQAEQFSEAFMFQSFIAFLPQSGGKCSCGFQS